MDERHDAHEHKVGARFDRQGHVIEAFADARTLERQQKEAVVTLERPEGAAFTLRSDEGPYLDGDDAAPPPLSYLTSSIAF